MVEEVKAKKEKIQEDLNTHIISFSTKSKNNKKSSIRQHFSITVLGAVITILSGLNIAILSEYSRISTLILASIVTVLGAYKTYFNNKELWIKYMSTSNKLKNIQSDFNYFSAGKEEVEIKLEDLERFQNKIQEVLNENNNEWESIRLQKIK